MPIYKTTKCINCQKLYQITLKRFNESIKNNWKFYCSRSCLSEHKSKQIAVECNNPDCNKTFKRSSNSKIKNHYCSSSCAAKINNLGRVRTPQGNMSTFIFNKNKSNKITKQIIKRHKLPQKFCANPTCDKQILNKNTYCSNVCQQAAQRKPVEYYRQIVIKEIQDFVSRNGRNPVKREMNSACKHARNVFGSWNKAIKAAGFKPNPVLFAHKHRAKDGHMCDSLAEKIIDDWLSSNKVPHDRSVPYPTNPKLTCDFVVYDIWIEFFGLAGDIKEYDRLMNLKYKIVKKHNLKFIPIYPKHMFPKPMLNEILLPKVKKFADN